MLRTTRAAARAAFLVSALLAAAPAPCEEIGEWQWLEPPLEARPLAWAKAHTDTSAKALQALPGYAALREEVAKKLSVERSTLDGAPVLLGPRALRLKRNAANPVGLLQATLRLEDGTLGEWKTILDVAALGKSEGKKLQLQWFGDPGCLPPRYDRCLLHLSDQGSDETAIREFDVETGAFVPGGFVTPPSRTFAAYLDRDTLLVVHALGDAPKTAAGWGAAVRLWKRGEPLEKSRVVYTAQKTDAILMVSAVGPASARRGLVMRAIDFSTFQLLTVDREGRVEALPIPAKLKAFGLQAASERHLFVQLAEEAPVGGATAPAESILAWDLRAKAADPAGLQIVYTPAAGEVVPDWTMAGTATRTAAVFPLQKGLSRSLAAARSDGTKWTVKPFVEAPAGTDVRALGADPAGEDLVVQSVGFLQPAKLELYRPGTPARTISADPALFDASRLVVETRTAKAGDGTPISYWLVKPRQAAAPGETPTLMTGYGAFGVSFPIGYADEFYGGVTMASWLERGGALVVPAIRGGGEGGEAWHRAAMREKRIVSYGDFFAVAEDLLATKLTRRERLGVFGMSNGGLLAAVAGTQRPDLFGASVVDVPLTDMLRYPKMGMGAAWMDEYGNPDDPAMREVLLKYSPFHNVKPGVTYPAFFVTVSTHDNRVGPGHARKLAGRLESVGTEVFYLEEQEGGHGVSDALKHPDLMAMRLAFLFSKLTTAK
ncbi:MAG: prolyl oligopeptidase family serine peptidase [Thermoanaerobaculia bacterium]